MPITREVITDLWPVFLSGEASADTRALVEDFLQHDPEFARGIQQERPHSVLPEVPSTLPLDHEMTTLVRTKRLLRRRSMWLALAILFTCLPFSFAFDRSGAHWLYWSQAPGMARTFLLLGVGSWIGYFLTTRRVQAKGF
jgi:hypothetical protein